VYTSGSLVHALRGLRGLLARLTAHWYETDTGCAVSQAVGVKVRVVTSVLTCASGVMVIFSGRSDALRERVVFCLYPKTNVP
jgi:hypothetical protein